MHSYDKTVRAKKTKYRDDRTDLQYPLFAHVPDTANEWDFFPPVRVRSAICKKGG